MNATNEVRGVPALRNEAPQMAPGTTTATPEPELGKLTPLRTTTPTVVWNWTVRETLWTVDVFTRMFATIVVLRTVSQLVSRWWFPRKEWGAGPTLVRGFGSAPQPSPTDTSTTESTVEDEVPEFVMNFEGERFYRHG